jgi:hypothetical protein
VTESKLMNSSNSGEVVVRVVYKNGKDAQTAVSKFDGQVADGRKLSVRILGAVAADLGHRLGNKTVQNGSVDALIGAENGGSCVTLHDLSLSLHDMKLTVEAYRKMRSDAIMATDSRASVMVAPPGSNPTGYAGNEGRRGGGGKRGGRRRGGGARGGRRGAAPSGGMDVD